MAIFFLLNIVICKVICDFIILCDLFFVAEGIVTELEIVPSHFPSDIYFAAWPCVLSITLCHTYSCLILIIFVFTKTL